MTKIETCDISGMGGGYEKTCQKMLWETVAWLKDKPKDIFNGTKEYKNIYGIIELPEPLQEIENRLAEKYDCTGAMMQAVMSHARYIHTHSHAEWLAKLREVREPQDFYTTGVK